MTIAIIYLAILSMTQTLSVRAENEPFALRIYTPKDDNLFIKTLAEDWSIDDRTQEYFAAQEDLQSDYVEDAPPPNFNQYKDGLYSVKGMIYWSAPIPGTSIPAIRSFWVGTKDLENRNRDLLKCRVIPERWMKNDIYIYLGPEHSVTWSGKKDDLRVGWIRCLGPNATAEEWEGSTAWDARYFVRPSDEEYQKERWMEFSAVQV